MQNAVAVVEEPVPPVPAAEPLDLLRWQGRIQRPIPPGPLDPVIEERQPEARRPPEFNRGEPNQPDPAVENRFRQGLFNVLNPPAQPPEGLGRPQWDDELNARRFNDFDEDALEGDDFDGVWDILGMQGPIIGLLHNTVFSALMIALAVGLGVWLPFMFGKTALGALVWLVRTWLIVGTSVGGFAPASIHSTSIECRRMSRPRVIFYRWDLITRSWNRPTFSHHFQNSDSSILTIP
jgi:hypothetical protein